MVVETPKTESPSIILRRRQENIFIMTPNRSKGFLENNNDEEERRQRKKSILLSSNLSPTSGHATPRSRLISNTSEDLPRNHAGLTYAQLREHNANCVKLSSENKINAKNAFALYLIDYMKVLVRQSQREDETTNFQSASCTLDAGVKIYASRVDSVHADAYKMLGSLGRATVDEEEGGDQEPEDKEQEKQRAKKKTVRGPGKTIEKNLKALNCEKFDLTFEVDPFFHKTSATFDEGGIGGLLSNHLQIKDETYELMLDSEHKILNTEDSEKSCVKDPIQLSSFKDISARLLDENAEICPQFREFVFTGWDRHAEDWVQSQGRDSHRFDQDASLLEEDDNGGAGVDTSDLARDEDDIYPGNNDDLSMTGDANDGSSYSDSPRRHGSPQRPRGGNQDGTYRLEFSLQPTEYSYFRQDVMDAWAGPGHWKVKSNLKGNSSKPGQNEGEPVKKKRDKKSKFTYNYEDDSVIQGIENAGKTAKTLSIATRKKVSVDQTTLPEDIHYDLENFTRLFIKPTVKVRKHFEPSMEGEPDLFGYDYGNRCDMDNFCPALQDGDDDDYDGCNVGAGNNTVESYGDSMTNVTQPVFDVTVGDATFFAGDNLVNQPNKVQKIHISYAKTAKRIDIKKLKKAMWDTLTAEADQDKENIPENEEEGSNLDDQDESHSFKEMYQTLPGRLSHDANKNLSVPIAFVCLLYLANEKGLHLTASEDMADFSIAKDKF